MPALVAAPKTSKEESIARKRQILEATQAERLDVLGPHLDLLIRLRAMLPPAAQTSSRSKHSTPKSR